MPHTTINADPAAVSAAGASVPSRISQACALADQLLHAKKLKLTAWMAYTRLVKCCGKNTYTNMRADRLAAAIGCAPEYVTVVFSQLRALGLIWRRRVGNSWRTYISFFEPEPTIADDPIVVEPSAAEPSAAELAPAEPSAAGCLWAALALLNMAAQLAEDPTATIADRRPGDSESDRAAPAPAGAFFSPDSVDPKNESSQLNSSVHIDLTSPVASGVAAASVADAPSASLPPGRVAGGGSLPNTPAVGLIVGFAASIGEPIFDRAALLRHADRSVADVELAIAAARVRGHKSPIGLLFRMLDQGVWRGSRKRSGYAPGGAAGAVDAADPGGTLAAVGGGLPGAAGPPSGGDPRLAELWQAVRDRLAAHLSAAEFATWIAESSLVMLDQGVAVVGVSNVFQRDRVAADYSNMIADALADLDAGRVAVRVVIDSRGGYVSA